MFEERVQKAMSRLGFGSRREIERWIEQGRVKVNGQTIELGARVHEGDRVQCNGRRAVIKEPTRQVRILAYNKPEGEVCSRKDEQGRRTVYQSLPGLRNGRWVSIGRLDINTTGLLLFTSDGELANRLMHPGSEVEREYAVRVNGRVDDDKLRKLTRGVELEDGPARFDAIEDAEPEGEDKSGSRSANHWYHVILREGRNREVRRLWEAVDTRVSRLIRVRYGQYTLPRNLRQGKSQELSFEEVEQICKQVGLTCEPPAPQRVRGAARKAKYAGGGSTNRKKSARSKPRGR